MQEYHETRAVTSSTNPYAYEVVPPIGKLLEIVCEDRSVGGCFRPGNRKLADRMGYASASQIPYLLSQLACDGWISYDPSTGVIMLLRDPRESESDQAIRSPDRSLEQITDAAFDDDLQVIDPIDRDLEQQDAETTSDQLSRSILQRMEDSCLTTATHDSESAAVKTQIPCAANSISPTDHPIALLLSELLPPPGRGVLDKVLSAQPPWTPQQIRDRYAYDKPRIEASGGAKTWGIFWDCLKSGERAPARPDPHRPLNPESYADRDGFALGSEAPPGPDSAESIRDHAARLLPKPTAETLKTYTRDWLFVQGRLGAGDSDEAAMQALEKYRTAVRR